MTAISARANAAWKTVLQAMLSVCALATFTSDAVASGNASSPDNGAAGLCEREIQSAAAKYGIPEGILYSVGLTETGRKGSLYPYALNIEGKPYFPASQNAALQTFAAAKQNGAKLIDIGCMQINQYFHGENFASVAAMFDPHSNVEYAAKFLRDLHDRHETWTMAVARYHAGPNNDPAQKVYVCRVIANLVATGYGKWTPNAANFCHD
ncbi:transglycosylase SLT domain-containing protein [Rhizobium sp. ICMP 5592]|uniref:transglycosylase SLT domain-containing protein n=1 Tax=Rhizobium sp. ICMP 5592 TaxID=2292445 RepID=UPI0025708952|nr:transglycosylase SLT domain-containing protein [Rhizobium sp. ICMP 5592]